MMGANLRAFEIEYYEKASGEEPVRDFIEAQPTKMRAKIASTLSVLQALGNMVREPYSKQLEDGIFELRCQVASEITRILYFFHEGKIVVLTNGFVKKQQKTPRAQIELAKERRADYLRRCGDDNVQ